MPGWSGAVRVQSVINFCVLLGPSSEISITSEAHNNIANTNPEEIEIKTEQVRTEIAENNKV